MRDPNKISSRAKLFWQRMTQWYGTRIVEQYGSHPPQDWCLVVDAATDETMRKALAELKQKHVSHPPSFPEFDAIVAKSAAKPKSNEPNMQSLLCKFVLNHRTLSKSQVRMPWKYIYHGDTRSGAGFEIVGVEVPADGDAPGYRVMAEDMQLEQAA